MRLSQIIGELSLGYHVTDSKGKTWNLGFITDMQKTFFVRQMILADMKAVEDNPAYTETERRSRRSLIDERIAEDYYEFGGERFESFIKTAKGSVVFVQSLLLKNHPTVTADDAYNLFADKSNEIIAIINLIRTDSVIARAGDKVDSVDKDAIKKLYQRFTKPTMEGGFGMTIEQVSALTDQQKNLILASTEEPKSEPVPTEYASVVDPSRPEMQKLFAAMDTYAERYMGNRG